MINHIQAIRKIPGCGSAIVVFVPESNLAFEGIHQEHALRRSGVRDVCVMHEDDNRAGIRTNNDLKKGMAIAFQGVVSKKRLRFHEKFVCLTEKYSPDEMREDMLNQLMNYSRIIIQSKQPHKPPTEFYGGKRGYGYDDHAVAMQLNLIMKRRFYQSERYKPWCE